MAARLSIERQNAMIREAVAGPKTAPNAVSKAPQKAKMKKPGWAMLGVGLALALVVVLLVPLLAGGSTPVAVRAAAPSAFAHVASYNSVEDAQMAAGFEAVLPSVLTEDVARLTAVSVLEGDVLEFRYVLSGGEVILFRTALGNEDVSGVTRDYTVTSTEEADGVIRTYAGTTEKLMNVCTWAAKDRTYAILAESGVDASVMRQIAESVR